MIPPPRLFTGADGVARCWWCGTDADYVRYHDEEWGLPSGDDRRLFETLCLEGFQAGLSWLTILRRRPRFREVFSGFDIDAVGRYTEADVERLLADPGIIRHRGKITATIANARKAADLAEEWGSLAAYLWRDEPGRSPVPEPGGLGEPAAGPVSESPESNALSRDLKRRGWRFVGPTTVYAFMQAVGMVNDHVAGCARRETCAAARQTFRPPRPG